MFTLQPPRTPEPIVVITDGVSVPNGICLSKAGTLYVANNNGSITVYLAGQTSPSQVLTTGLRQPNKCVIDNADNLWVSDFAMNDVVKFHKGDTSPSIVLTQGINSPQGLAIDKLGNLYVANFASDVVKVYAKGSTSPSRSIIVAAPTGLAMDQHQILYVVSRPSTFEGYVQEFRDGENSPFQTITLVNWQVLGDGVSPKGRLYVAAITPYPKWSPIVLEYGAGETKPLKNKIAQQISLAVDVKPLIQR